MSFITCMKFSIIGYKTVRTIPYSMNTLKNTNPSLIINRARITSPFCIVPPRRIYALRLLAAHLDCPQQVPRRRQQVILVLLPVQILRRVAHGTVQKAAGGDPFIYVMHPIFERASLAVLAYLDDCRPRQKIHAAFPAVHVPLRPCIKRRALSAVLNVHAHRPFSRRRSRSRQVYGSTERRYSLDGRSDGSLGHSACTPGTEPGQHLQ